MSGCKRVWEVDALREGRLNSIDADSFTRHRRGCRVCAQTFSEDEKLRELGRALPSPAPNEMHVRRLRGEILRRAGEASTAQAPSRSRHLAWASLVAAALAVASILLANHRASTRVIPPLPLATLAAEPSLAATVTARSGARWTQRREGRVERVRLDDGALLVQVRHQNTDERFLLDLPDGELEVRGTRFEIVVRAGRTISVDVFEGLVALRQVGENEVLIGAGEVWRKALDVESLPSHAAAAVAPVTAPLPKTARTPATRAPAALPLAAVESTDYARAMDRYRARDYVEAGRAFHAFTSGHPDAAEAEDATFLEATALARGGRSDAASLVAERFLERYPASFHARDAAILVARAARERGDCGKARATLAPWKTTSPEEVAAALGSCGE